MLRTEDDLIEALRMPEAQAPAVAERTQRSLAQATGRRRFSVALTLTAVAAAVALIPITILSVPRLLADRHGGQTPAHPTTIRSGRHPLAFTAQFPTIPGLVIVGGETSQDVQTFVIDPPNSGKSLGTIRVYDEGRYDPEPNRGGTSIMINGRQAWYEVLAVPPDAPDPSRPDPTSSETAFKTVLTWEYQAHSWAVAEIDDGSPAGLSRLENLAQGMRVGSPQSLKVPYRLRYLPASLQIKSGVRDGKDGPQLRSIIQFGDELPTDPNSEFPGTALAIDVTPSDSVPHDGRPLPDRVAGHPAVWHSDGGVSVDFGSAWVAIGLDNKHLGRYPRAELERIVAGIELTPAFQDPTQWYDATTAIPRH